MIHIREQRKMSQNSNENLSSEATMENADNMENVDNVEPTTDQSQSEITTTASIASSSPATSLQSLSLATSASIDGKNDKLKITLDNPQNTYYSGQTIRGTISLNSKQKKKIRGECY